MKLPRDVSGLELAGLLRRYGFEISRQTGLTSRIMGSEQHITIPAHKSLKIGTLSGILSSVAEYLQIERNTLAADLFE